MYCQLKYDKIFWKRTIFFSEKSLIFCVVLTVLSFVSIIRENMGKWSDISVKNIPLIIRLVIISLQNILSMIVADWFCIRVGLHIIGRKAYEYNISINSALPKWVPVLYWSLPLNTRFYFQSWWKLNFRKMGIKFMNVSICRSIHHTNKYVICMIIFCNWNFNK